MSMSSNELDSQEFSVPVKSFSYRDMGAPAPFQVNETRQAGAQNRNVSRQWRRAFRRKKSRLC